MWYLTTGIVHENIPVFIQCIRASMLFSAHVCGFADAYMYVSFHIHYMTEASYHVIILDPSTGLAFMKQLFTSKDKDDTLWLNISAKLPINPFRCTTFHQL